MGKGAVGVTFLSTTGVKSISFRPFRHLNRFVGCSDSAPRRTLREIGSVSILVVGGILIGGRLVSTTRGLGLVYVSTANIGGVSIRCTNSGKVPIEGITKCSASSITRAAFARVLTLINKIHCFSSDIGSNDCSHDKVFASPG